MSGRTSVRELTSIYFAGFSVFLLLFYRPLQRDLSLPRLVRAWSQRDFPACSHLAGVRSSVTGRPHVGRLRLKSQTSVRGTQEATYAPSCMAGQGSPAWDPDPKSTEEKATLQKGQGHCQVFQR